MRSPLPLLLAVACLPQVGPLVDGGGTGGGTSIEDGGTGGGGTAAGCPGFAGCTAFTDGTAITFPNGDQTFAPLCLRVRVGQPVSFNGDLADHPVVQVCGPAAAISSTASVTFTVPGVYGYYCTTHGSAAGIGMAGAIEVVP